MFLLILFQVPQEISKRTTRQPVRQYVSGRQPRDRQQDPETETGMGGGQVTSRSGGLLGASVSRIGISSESRQNRQIEALRGQARSRLQEPEEGGALGGGGAEGTWVNAENQKQNRNKLQMENAVALRQNRVDFGS